MKHGLIILCLMILAAPSAKAITCKELVKFFINPKAAQMVNPPWSLIGEQSQLEDGTQFFIMYLNQLIDAGLLRDAHITYFKARLEEGYLVNPFYDLNSFSKIPNEAPHRQHLQEFINTRYLDRETLLSWAENLIQKNSWSNVVHDRSHEMAWVQVKKDKVHFSIQHGSEYRNAELTKNIEVMDSFVTQKQWLELMGANPSFAHTGLETAIRIEGDVRVPLQPDFAVENITWWSTLEFANRLSIRDGLPPVYDLSEIEFDSNTSAELGTLTPKVLGVYKADDVAMKKIKINAPGGNIYRAQGYRLPTVTEQHLLMSSANGWSSFISDYPRDEYDFDINTERAADPYRSKVNYIETQKIYGLSSNLLSFSWDRRHKGFPEGKDPVGKPNEAFDYVAVVGFDTERIGMRRFGGFNHSFDNILQVSFRKPLVGFRLVRTVSNP